MCACLEPVSHPFLDIILEDWKLDYNSYIVIFLIIIIMMLLRIKFKNNYKENKMMIISLMIFFIVVIVWISLLIYIDKDVIYT